MVLGTDFVHDHIDEKCLGCEKTYKVDAGTYCTIWMVPSARWRRGETCPMATHVQRKEGEKKGFVDPLKKSKQSMRKR